MRSILGVVGLGLGLLLAIPSVWAADESTAEAAQVPTSADHPSREQILQAIETTRQTDPELAAEMENQLQLFESGELDLSAELGVPRGTTQEDDVTAGLSAGIRNAGLSPGLVGPPVEDGQNAMPSYMTPELQEQLSNVFDRRAGGELTEEQARAQAEAILQEHGIDPREMGPGHEGDWEHEEGQWQGDRGEGFERAYIEQMSPEAREQMERFFNEHETSEQPTMDRETFEREFGTFEAPTHEYEAPDQEYEAPEGPMPPEYDPPEYDYQPPQQP